MARATATYSGSASPASGCVFCTLGSTGQGFTTSGSGSITITGGAFVDDSSLCAGNSVAFSAGGSGSFTASSIGVVGCAKVGNNFTTNPYPQSNVSPVADPLASVPEPTVNSPNQGSLTMNSGYVTLNPGVYSTVKASGGSLTLNPGLYVVTGSFALSGSINVTGSGVTIFLACSAYPTPCSSAGEAGATMSFGGGGSLQMSAPTSGTYQGLLVFYDRNNNSQLPINGGNGQTLSGTIYAASSTANFSGTAGAVQVNSQIIVGAANWGGSSNWTIAYQGSQNYAGTSSSSLPKLTA